MKFREFFERSTDAQKNARFTLLTGEDLILKNIVVEHMGALTGLWDVRERFEVKDTRSIVSLWEEGSLMGARFLDVRVGGKLKVHQSWKPFLTGLSAGKNYMVVSFPGGESQAPWEGIPARPVFQTVECNFPKRTQDRMRLVDLRLRSKGCPLDKEMLKELTIRVKSSEEIETAVMMLSILGQSGKITEQEITYAAGERDDLRSTLRAIARGNNVVLLEEMERMEPLPLLAKWHAILKTMYCWIGQQTGEDDRKEDPDDEEADDEDVSEALVTTEIKLSRYQAEDYKLARKNYSPVLLRQIMEKINEVYQDIRRGKQEGWQERVRFILSMMPK